MCTVSNRKSGSVKDASGEEKWRVILALWHSMQERAQATTWLFILGQTKRSATSFLVALMPGWERSYNRSYAERRKADGKNGLGLPVEISHHN